MRVPESIVCPSCGTLNPAGFNFCGNCGKPLLSEEAVTPPNAERRQITVVFCDLAGSTALSVNLDPEDLRDVIGRYQDVCVDVIEGYDGYIAQYLGDGVMAYFGYPVAHEGEPERAVRAGLDILNRIGLLSRELRAEYGIDITVRIGVHTGLVVVGEIGSGARREHLALGETPNLAARLQGISPENGLVVSEATYRLIAGAFECEDLGAQQLKGMAREERAYRVVEERLSASPLDLAGFDRPADGSGREEQLETFRSKWKAAAAGEGSVLIVRGDAGIGKSHVVQLFRQDLQGRPHHRVECRCSQHLQSAAFHPIVDWLHRTLNFYAGQPDGDRLDMLEFVVSQNRLSDPHAVALLTSLLNVPSGERYPDPGFDPSLAKDRTHGVLEELILSTAADRPLIVIVDDVQWIDPSTRSFLQRFGAGLSRRPVLLVLMSRTRIRSLFPDDVQIDEIVLERISREHVQWIMEDVLDGKLVPPQVIDQIYEKTDGVPLYVQEFTKMAVEAGLMVESDHCYELAQDAPELAIPATLQDSLMARLDRLQPVKEVAQLCSVLGREFGFDLAHAVSGMTEGALIAALDRLVEAELLVVKGRPPTSRYMFRHSLIQEAAYESMLRSRRSQYHRQVAAYLIADPEAAKLRPEIIAHHLSRAGERERAARYWCAAGQLAQERWANEEAVEYFSRGRDLLQKLPESGDTRRQAFFLNAGLAAASLQLKGYTHLTVLEAFEEAARLADEIGEAAVCAPVVRGIWAHYTVLGDHGRAEALARQLILLAEQSDDPMLMMEALTARASTSFWKGEVTEAKEILEGVVVRFVDTLERRPRAAQHPYVGALSYLSVALWYLGYPDQAIRRSDESMAAARGIDHPFSTAFAAGFRALLHTYLNDLEEARRCADVTVDVSSRYGFSFWLSVGYLIRAWTQHEDDPETAVDRLQTGLRGLEKAGVRIWTAYPSALLTDLLGRLGRPSEALRLLDGVIERSRTGGESYFLPELYRIRALQLDALDRSAEAKRSRRTALDVARAQRARPLIVRTLLDMLNRETSPRKELRELLRTTTASFTEGLETDEVMEARRITASA